MVIVATVALSTMLCNDLIMPVLLRIRWLRLNRAPRPLGPAAGDPARQHPRHAAARLRLLQDRRRSRTRSPRWAWCRSAPRPSSRRRSCSASTGRRATLRGALTGLCSGFLIWLYTLLLPALARSGWLDAGFLEAGPFGYRACSSPRRCSGSTGSTRSATRCCGACSPTSSCLVGWSLLGAPGQLRARPGVLVRRGRPARRRAALLARPRRDRRHPGAADALRRRRAGRATRSPATPARAASRSPPTPRPMPTWSTSPSACWPARSARPRRG